MFCHNILIFPKLNTDGLINTSNCFLSVKLFFFVMIGDITYNKYLFTNLIKYYTQIQ